MARKGHDLNIGAALPSGKQVEDVLEEVLNILFKKSERSKTIKLIAGSSQAIEAIIGLPAQSVDFI